MESTFKEENVIHKDIHRGYEFVIKLINNSHYCCYVKIPNNHMYNGLNYDAIDIIAHGGLSFSERIENDWWIGWDYLGYLGDNVNKYEIKDVFMDCCYVITQLIEKEMEKHNNVIEGGKSRLSNEILEYLSDINSKKLDDNIDINSKCVICGKPIPRSKYYL